MVSAAAVLLAVLGLIAATGTTIAHPGEQHRHRREQQQYASASSLGPIPSFNPSEALNYASASSVDYYLSSTTTIATTTEAPKSKPTTTTSCTSSGAHSHSQPESLSSASVSPSTPATPAPSTPATPSSNPPPSSTTQTVLEVTGTGIAVANRPAEYFAAVGGVLIAGLAMV